MRTSLVCTVSWSNQHDNGNLFLDEAFCSCVVRLLNRHHLYTIALLRRVHGASPKDANRHETAVRVLGILTETAVSQAKPQAFREVQSPDEGNGAP